MSMDKFSKVEQTEILEIARIALADGDLFDYIAEELDLSDKYMLELRDKINEATAGEDEDADDVFDELDADEDDEFEDEDDEDEDEEENDLD